MDQESWVPRSIFRPEKREDYGPILASLIRNGYYRKYPHYQAGIAKKKTNKNMNAGL